MEGVQDAGGDRDEDVAQVLAVLGVGLGELDGALVGHDEDRHELLEVEVAGGVRGEEDVAQAGEDGDPQALHLFVLN